MSEPTEPQPDPRPPDVPEPAPSPDPVPAPQPPPGEPDPGPQGEDEHPLEAEYPDAEEEMEIVRRSGDPGRANPSPALTGADIQAVHQTIRAVPIADHVLRYALRLVRATRVSEPMDAGVERPRIVTDYLSWGAGPRASEYLVLAARAYAALHRGTHVSPDDIRAVAKPVLRHRILRNFNAEADQVTTDAIIDGLLQAIPVEGLSPQQKRQMDTVMR